MTDDSPRTDLTFATTEELFCELRSRFNAIIVIADAVGMNAGECQFLYRYFASPAHRLGMLRYAMLRTEDQIQRYVRDFNDETFRRSKADEEKNDD